MINALFLDNGTSGIKERPLIKGLYYIYDLEVR
jgi:hypothetical protein